MGGRSERSAGLAFAGEPGGAADAGEIGPGATPPRTRARPSPKAASRSRIPLGVTRFLLNPCSDRPPPAGPPGRARSPHLTRNLLRRRPFRPFRPPPSPPRGGPRVGRLDRRGGRKDPTAPSPTSPN